MSEVIKDYGFIYVISNKITGQWYCGKKAYYHTIKKKLSKKRRKGTRKRVERVQVDSGWKDYYGSSNILSEDIKKLGKENFELSHIRECKDKQSLAYWEQYYLFLWGAIFDDNCYNGNIAAKFFRGKITK